MLSPINLRGYEGDDPLDRLPPASRYLLAMAVTAVVSTLLVILITRVFRLVQFAGLWVDYVDVASLHTARGAMRGNVPEVHLAPPLCLRSPAALCS